MSKMKTAAEIREELKSAEAKLKAALSLKARLEQQMKMVQEEIVELGGGIFSRESGKICWLKQQLQHAERREAHRALPQVRVLKKDWKGNERLDEYNYVVTSCGPKRIGLSRIGYETKDLFHATNGEAVGYGGSRIHPADLERIKREGK